MVECAKLFPKMHVFHFGHLFYVLYAHHPDTARPFFGPGMYSLLVCMLTYVFVCVVRVCVRACVRVCMYMIMCVCIVCVCVKFVV